MHKALPVLLLVSACAQAPTSPQPAGPEPAGPKFSFSQDSATELLRFMDEMDGMNNRQWAAAYKRIQAEYAKDATSANRLRVALALGNPSRPPEDLEKSIAILQELLAISKSLPPGQYYVARTRLASIRKRATVEAENEALKAALTRAEKKISALTSLEHNLEKEP